MPAARAPLLASLLLLALGPAPTRAQADPGALNRCVDAEGNAVYTDRACEALDARPARTAPPNPDTLPADAPVVRDCARTPEALLVAVEEALAAADGNRLAALYDWRGRSGAAAEVVMPRLEAIAASRFIEASTAHSAEGSDDAELAAEAAEAPPDRLRIVHSPDGLGTGETTEFRLVRAAGCWWFAD
ncbi:hypothetical protein [Silanimonas sp.]|jgi:hypothetical protein|uniref:hypothetical protein n=1 Tax=Silanimonas sp. TaxID=1929290 RepID=UPI0022C85285|nr:hypothetical protein [Silanimonas sp.]MCZ8165963.1 hypothetical protein [Silanimonas sp.]